MNDVLAARDAAIANSIFSIRANGLTQEEARIVWETARNIARQSIETARKEIEQTGVIANDNMLSVYMLALGTIEKMKAASGAAKILVIKEMVESGALHDAGYSSLAEWAEDFWRGRMEETSARSVASQISALISMLQYIKDDDDAIASLMAQPAKAQRIVSIVRPAIRYAERTGEYGVVDAAISKAKELMSPDVSYRELKEEIAKAKREMLPGAKSAQFVTETYRILTPSGDIIVTVTDDPSVSARLGKNASVADVMTVLNIIGNFFPIAMQEYAKMLLAQE